MILIFQIGIILALVQLLIKREESWDTIKFLVGNEGLVRCLLPSNFKLKALFDFYLQGSFAKELHKVLGVKSDVDQLKPLERIMYYKNYIASKALSYMEVFDQAHGTCIHV